MPNVLRLWFGLSLPVDRRHYFLSGAGLAALKYAGDDMLVRTATGHSWSPIDYLSPFATTRLTLASQPEWLLPTMAAWALPFAWIGTSMTLRRLLDARWPPEAVLLFFVPGVNWALLAALCVLPSRGSPEVREKVNRDVPWIFAAMQGVAGGIAVGAISLLLHVLLLKSYDAFVFLGTPFVMGGFAGYVYNRRVPREKTAMLGALTVVLAGGMMLLFALEGIVCIVMALPLAIPLGSLGAVAGKLIAAERRDSSPALLAIMLAISPVASLEKPPLREVLSMVEIDASPADVWPHVLSFSELDEPLQWYFRLGIAYPVRAQIAGRGKGAVRHCEFSTGAFVEPITAWEEPSRLAFDVASQPAPLTEWSPYRVVYAEHLQGTLRSRRGEFRLIALPGGRTRLEGRTFYELSMAPQPYWAMFGDAIIHRIHDRVLQHIRTEVEGRPRTR
jgi:hypothetical protein